MIEDILALMPPLPEGVTRDRVVDGARTRCPWCDVPTNSGGWHSACLDEYVSSAPFERWRERYESGHDPCDLCGGNRRTCRC